MRGVHLSKGFGICCTIITFGLAIAGAAVAIVGAFKKDATIVAAGFSAMVAAIWMLWKSKPVQRL